MAKVSVEAEARGYTLTLGDDECALKRQVVEDMQVNPAQITEAIDTP